MRMRLRRMRTARCGAGLRLWGILAWLVATPAAGVVFGQSDDFQDGSVQNWDGGASPTNVATGGPAGVGDRYLEISSVSFNLGAFNATQWTGDYDGEGIAKLNMKLNNLGSEPLAIRIILFSNSSSYTTTNETVLPAASGWVSADFFLDSTSLTLTSGFETLEQVLSGVATLALRHDPDPLDPPGTQNHVTGTLGLDDITALPEPGVVPMLIAGVASIGGLRASRRATMG